MDCGSRRGRNGHLRSLEQLHQALKRTVANAGEEKQVKLIQAHPDLVGTGGVGGDVDAGIESGTGQRGIGAD